MSNDSGKSVVLQNEGARNLFPHPQKKKKKKTAFSEAACPVKTTEMLESD